LGLGSSFSFFLFWVFLFFGLDMLGFGGLALAGWFGILFFF